MSEGPRVQNGDWALWGRGRKKSAETRGIGAQRIEAASWIPRPWTDRWHCIRPVHLHSGLFGHRALDQKTDWLALCLHCGHIRTMSKTATIRTRIEPVLKSEVEAILAQLGLTASEAVHLLYRQIQLQRGLPFEVRLPNKLTTTVLNASKAGRNVKRFGTKKELYSDLGI